MQSMPLSGESTHFDFPEWMLQLQVAEYVQLIKSV